MNHHDIVEWPVPVTSLSPVSSATVVWRREGRLMLTVVVKATLKWVPGGTAELIEPAPIHTAEQRRSGGVTEVPDLAPALQQAEVTAWGMSGAAGEVDVALVVGVGEKRLLVKQARVAGPLISCFAPLSLSERRQLSPHAGQDVVQARSLRDVRDVVDGFDGSGQQQAPVDQRLQALRGDEWIATRGMHPQHRELATRLPAYYAMVRLYGGEALPQAPLPLRLDSLHLMVHELRGSLVWRGHWPLLSDRIPADLQVAAGVAPFGEILELGDLPPSDVIEEPDSEGDPWESMRQTRAVTDDELKSMAEALPDSIPGDRERAGEALFAELPTHQTVPLPHDLHAALEQAFSEAAPFALAAKGAVAPPAQLGAIPGAPWADDAAKPPARASVSQIETVSEMRPSAQAEMMEGARAHARAASAQQARQEREAALQAEQKALKVEQEALKAEQEARQRREAVLKAEQEERARAAREAEERRAQEAQRFAEEQRQAKQREQERKQKEADEQRDKRLNLRSSLYARAKKRRA